MSGLSPETLEVIYSYQSPPFSDSIEFDRRDGVADVLNETQVYALRALAEGRDPYLHLRVHTDMVMKRGNSPRGRVLIYTIWGITESLPPDQRPLATIANIARHRGLDQRGVAAVLGTIMADSDLSPLVRVGRGYAVGDRFLAYGLLQLEDPSRFAVAYESGQLHSELEESFRLHQFRGTRQLRLF